MAGRVPGKAHGSARLKLSRRPGRRNQFRARDARPTSGRRPGPASGGGPRGKST